MINTKSIKTWLRIVRPNKWLFFWQFLTALIPAIINILITIPAANLINSLSVYNYDSAKYFLIHILILLFIEFIFWNINYFLYPIQLKRIYKKTHDQIFNKILSSSDEDLKINSKEKMMNILSTNLLSMINFTNSFSQKFSYLITSIIMLCIILHYNFTLAIITIGIALLSYFLYTFFNFLLAKRTIKIQSDRDDIVENFSYVVDGRNLSTDLNLISKLKEKYDLSVKNMIKSYKKEHILKLFANKWVYFIWKLLIYITTFYLISLVENDTITLTIYLLLTPYLTSTIENLYEFFSVYSDLNIAKISALRIKTILDMSEKDIINFGNNKTNEIEGIISFTNISFKPNSYEKIYGKINYLNLQIQKNKIYLFAGKKNCGKRAIFYMLRRKIRPSTGTITFDTINIYDFDKQTYINNISYTTSSPYFFNDSIINNLKYINKNIRTIKETTRFLNIDTLIENLPNGYNTNLLKDKELISSYLYFMIGLARAILSNSEILCIYEFPIGLSHNEINNIKNILKTYKKHHTILIFCAINPLDGIIDEQFNIENGNVKQIKMNNSTNITHTTNRKLIKESHNEKRKK